MHICPHCKQEGVTSLQKLCSVTFAPAICAICHRRSFLQLVYGLYALILWIILTWIFIGVALYQQMTFYMLGTIPAMFLAVDKYMLRAPLSCLPA